MKNEESTINEFQFTLMDILRNETNGSLSQQKVTTILIFEDFYKNSPSQNSCFERILKFST